MKIGINLLVKQDQYLKLENIFKQLKLVLVLFCLVTLAEYIGLYIVVQKQRQFTGQLQAQNQTLLNFLVKNKEVEANLVYFKQKEKQLTSILKSDVNFFPYYNLLNNTLHRYSPEAKLLSLKMNSSKVADFTLEFGSYASMLAFFQFAESGAFADNFSSLVLSKLTASPGSGQSYQLIFKGTFKELRAN